MKLPRAMYLNKPDKSDPVNEMRVLCIKWGDFYAMAKWFTVWPRWWRIADGPTFEAGRISRLA